MSGTPTNPEPKKRGRWLRKLLWAGGGLVALLILLYFVVTSVAFLKGFVLPKAGRAFNATITLDDASISPFSQVVLRGLRVQTTGSEPFLTAKEVRARYSLLDILHGNINVDEVVLDTPTVTLVQNLDGTSNLDPILAATKGGKPAAPKARLSKPLQLNVRTVVLQHGTVAFKKASADGGRMLAELSALDVSAGNIRNDQPADLTLSAGLKFLTATKTNTDEVTASLRGKVSAKLSAELMPETVKADTELAVGGATGAFADAAGLSAKLNADLTLTDIKQLALNFTKGGAPLGAVTASGPCDLIQREGKLKLDITGIDKRVLNLAGAAMGIDFGPTTLNATNQIGLAKGGQLITINGQLVGGQLSLTQKGQTTPPLDLQIAYDVAVDQEAKTALVRSFTLNGTQNQKPLLSGALSKPMKLDWGKAEGAVEESALDLTVTDLNLADWRNFVGAYADAGRVSLTLRLLSQQAGKKLVLDLGSQVAGLTAKFGTNRLDQADLALQLRAQVSGFTNVNLSEVSVGLSQQREPVVALRGSGTYNTKTQDADLQTTLDAALPKLAALLARPDLKVNAGTAKFAGRVAQKNQGRNQPGAPRFDQTVIGDLQLAGFTGQYADYRFDRFETAVNLDFAVKNQLAEIRKFTGTVSQAGQAGGSFDVSGNYHLASQVGQFALKLSDLNQNVLRSFVAAALGDKSLASVSISANTTAKYDAKGESAVKGDLQVANLLITDPKGQLPKLPMTATVTLDAGLKNDVADIRQFVGNIRQGQQAGGSFDAKGNCDLKKQAGQLAFNLTDLNQITLRPFLTSALGDKTLASVSINARGTAHYNLKADSSVQADLQVTNLVVNDPSGKLPKTPLAAGLKLDGAMAKQVLDLRQLQLVLSPTSRATNQLQLAGKVDLSKSNAITGNLKLTADSLDLTPYYDLFAGDQKAGAKPTTPAKPTPASTVPAAGKPEPEPPAVNLPLQQFTFDANVGKLYLGEVAITNFVTTAKIDKGQVNLNPFQLTLNGAPVNARALLNLGVPGYQYDVTVTADRVPIEPFVNTFTPDKRGQFTGFIRANAQVKGAGTTGASLQKFASGQFDLSLTNANIQVVKSQTKILFIPINLGIIATVLGVPEIMQSPVTGVNARAGLGNGQITVQHADVVSDAFRAELAGVIPIREVLTNSPLDLPVDVSLRRALADKARLTPANTPTNVVFVKLPPFAKVAGTLGNPETKTDKLVIAGLIAQYGAGLIGGKAGGIVGAIGNLVTGQTPAAPTTQTNRLLQPKTTNAPAGNLLQDISRDVLQNLFKKKE
jgi:hypothetical protein